MWLERAVVLTEKNKIDISEYTDDMGSKDSGVTKQESLNEYSLKKMSRIMEEQLIKKALDKTRGNRTHAARLLEISHPALLSKMKGFGIQ